MKSLFIKNKEEIKRLYEMGEEDLSYEDLVEEIKKVIEVGDNDLVETFLDEMVNISEGAPEGEFDEWFEEWVNEDKE